MHNLYTKFIKLLEICKQLSKNLVNGYGNFPCRAFIPRFSDLEVVALPLASETGSMANKSVREYNDVGDVVVRSKSGHNSISK